MIVRNDSIKCVQENITVEEVEMLFDNGWNILYMTDVQGIYIGCITREEILYHLVEDFKFENYMSNLFNSANRYVCIYSSNYNAKQDTEHVKRRKFSDYIENNFADWALMKVVKNPYETSHSDFYFYGKCH